MIDDAALPQAMFPLSTVLIPTQVLPLHVFEPRYRTLAQELASGVTNEFGVVLIERGTETGGDDVRARVGTMARVAELGQFADGRWLMVCVGTSRFEIASWLPDDPYPVALSRRVAERPLDTADQPKLLELLDLIRSTRQKGAQIDQLDVQEDDSFALPSDPVAAVWALCDWAPLGSFDRQRLLCVDEPVQRLALLTELVSDVASAYDFRLGG
jgi:Lon protease-like protein